MSTLISTVQTVTSGPWLDIDGVGGSLAPLDGLLVVRQTEAVQTEIRALLDNLRHAKRETASDSERQ